LLRGASPTHATCPLPPCGWSCRTVDGLSTANHPSPQLLPLSRGRWHTHAGWGHAVATPSFASLLPPFTGVDGRLSRGGSWQQHTSLPADPNPSLSSTAPSWASVVRDGVSANSPLLQAVLTPRKDFFCLYELCIVNGLTAHVAIISTTGTQEKTLSCHLQAPSTSIAAPVA
jgi:hypothetical protein